MNLQKDELTKLAKNVHHGSKNDFIASLAESVTSKKDHGNNNWDGTLSPQDVVNLAKKSHDPKTRKPVYDIIVEEDAAAHHHLSAIEVLDLQDTRSLFCSLFSRPFLFCVCKTSSCQKTPDLSGQRDLDSYIFLPWVHTSYFCPFMCSKNCVAECGLGRRKV